MGDKGPSAPRALRGSAQLEARLRRFHAHELANRNRPGKARVAADLTVRLGLLTCSYATMSVIPFPQNMPAIVVFSLTCASMLGSWFHDAVHKNVPAPRPFVSLLARAGSAPVGFSPRWWHYKHVRLHHRYVGNPEFDPDIQFGRLARVSPAQPWHPTHTTQHIHMWLLFPFATINMLKPSEVWFLRRFRRYPGIGAAPPSWVFLVDKYVPFAVFWAPVIIGQGPWPSLATFLTFQVLEGILVSLITQVQHNTELSDDGGESSTRWPLCDQLLRTSDVGATRGVWWWLCGGVNFHVCHHLVPTRSFLELPAATERLRANLCEIGVTLPVHRNIADALRSHTRLLRTLAHRPGIPTLERV